MALIVLIDMCLIGLRRCHARADEGFDGGVDCLLNGRLWDDHAC